MPFCWRCRMDIKNNIKTIGAFRKTVDALYTVVTILRVIAVAFLVIQTVLLILSPDKS